MVDSFDISECDAELVLRGKVALDPLDTRECSRSRHQASCTTHSISLRGKHLDQPSAEESGRSGHQDLRWVLLASIQGRPRLPGSLTRIPDLIHETRIEYPRFRRYRRRELSHDAAVELLDHP